MIKERIKSKQGQGVLIAIDEMLYPIYTSYLCKLTDKAPEAIGSRTFTIILKDALAVFHEDYTPVETVRVNLIDEKEETFDEKGIS